jgi:hypothetical protein
MRSGRLLRRCSPKRLRLPSEWRRLPIVHFTLSSEFFLCPSFPAKGTACKAAPPRVSDMLENGGDLSRFTMNLAQDRIWQERAGGGGRTVGRYFRRRRITAQHLIGQLRDAP